jgi:uncharacterized protein (DUF1499 family)
MVGVLSRIKDWKRGLTTSHAQLDLESPDERLRPLTLFRPAEEVAETINSWVETQPRWSLESRQDSQTGIAIHLIRRTRALGFVDDIHIRLEVDGNATRVEAESRSRIGKGDLGQNPRNLRELVGVLLNNR